MTARTTETTVTFRHPFTLAALERPQPAGTYRIVFDEEEIHGLSFLAFLRTATILHIPAISDPGALHQLYMVDSGELAAALEADEHARA
jgi:hypothetical protein